MGQEDIQATVERHNREIAELLKCSVGNSKSQLHKAKLRIRELLLQSQKGAAKRELEERITLRRPEPNGVRADVMAGLANYSPVFPVRTAQATGM